MFKIENLLRQNIKTMTAYKSARNDFRGIADIYLDANENPFTSEYNRYPDPYQTKLKSRISEIKNIEAKNIFLGNGSDEIIDLLIRAFCNPGKDNLLTISPSYGMYKVSAAINDVNVIEVKLDDEFNLDFKELQNAITNDTKIIFFCNPNNPSGNTFDPNEIINLTKKFNGIIVIDEAYIDFSNQHSLINYLHTYPNLLVMQTLSKAYAAAALRIGIAFADTEIIHILNKIKPPYNISAAAQYEALKILNNYDAILENVKEIIHEREKLYVLLNEHKSIKKVFKSEANFILIKVENAEHFYNYYMHHGIIIRNRHGQHNCDNCLRITVGTEKENQKFIEILNSYKYAENIIH